MSSLSRSLIVPAYLTARGSIQLPFPCDVDLAPQLVAVALAQAALAALHRALDSAHPILAALGPSSPPTPLSDSERFAILALDLGNDLAQLLADYNAAVVHDHLQDPDDSPF